jgi:hypothetical protein
MNDTPLLHIITIASYGRDNDYIVSEYITEYLIKELAKKCYSIPVMMMTFTHPLKRVLSLMTHTPCENMSSEYNNKFMLPILDPIKPSIVHIYRALFGIRETPNIQEDEYEFDRDLKRDKELMIDALGCKSIYELDDCINNAVDTFYNKILQSPTPITCEMMLKTLCNIFRDQYESFWIDLLDIFLKSLKRETIIILTDTQFKNEMEWAKTVGKVVRVHSYEKISFSYPDYNYTNEDEQFDDSYSISHSHNIDSEKIEPNILNVLIHDNFSPALFINECESLDLNQKVFNSFGSKQLVDSATAEQSGVIKKSEGDLVQKTKIEYNRHLSYPPSLDLDEFEFDREIYNYTSLEDLKAVVFSINWMKCLF